MSRSKRPIDFSKAIFPLVTMVAVVCLAAPLVRAGLEWLAGVGFFLLGVLGVYQFIRWRNDEYDKSHAALYCLERRTPIADRLTSAGDADEMQPACCVSAPAGTPDDSRDITTSSESEEPNPASAPLVPAQPAHSICPVGADSIEHGSMGAIADTTSADGSTTAPAMPGSPTESLTCFGGSFNVCPKCGAELKLKTVKKGANAGSQYWGCSTYPHCRYRLKLLPKAA